MDIILDKIKQIKFNRLNPEIKSIYFIINKIITKKDKDRLFLLYDDKMVGTYSTISNNVFLSWQFFDIIYLSIRSIDNDYLEECITQVLSDVLQIKISELFITKIENIRKSIKELEYEVKY